MPSDDISIVAEARSLIDELFASLHRLLNAGTMPDDLPTRYLAFVERVAARYGESEPLPREVMAVIYNASVYCTKRYLDWTRLTGKTNEVTERLANQMRWAGDRLVLGHYWKSAKPG